jgi:diacylglycerol kinase
MVCCALIAGLLGMLTLLLKPLIRKQSAMQWRLAPANGTAPSTRYITQAGLKFSIMARFRSFGFAFDGLRFAFVKEHNMRIHGAAAIAAVAAGIYFHITADEWRWIMLAVIFVVAAETINTAIEQACNAFGGAYNEHVRNAKDTAAGAVLLSSAAALIIGAAIFTPYLLAKYNEPPEIAAANRICGPDRIA